MSSQHSVSQWLEDLKNGNADAAQRIWTRYSHQLVELARRRLENAPKGMEDEEDIALSVLSSLCRGAEAGRFDELKSRDDLWWLLLAITKSKVIDHVRRETAQKRGGGHVQNESVLNHDADGSNVFRLNNIVGKDPISGSEGPSSGGGSQKW